jgi:hypothetical protein
MPQPVLVSDVTVEISIADDSQATGGAGSIPATPTVNFECQAKTVKATITARTVDLTTLCSETEATFTTGRTGTLDLELYVDEAQGPVFAYKTGYLCKVTINPGGAGSTLTYQGLITDSSLTYASSDVEMETAVIKLGAFGFTTVYS